MAAGDQGSEEARDFLAALLLLAPGAALACPGVLQSADLEPDLTGTGLVALISIPAAVLASLRGSRARGSLLLLGLFLFGLLSLVLHPPSDTLGATRTALLFGSGCAAFLCASTLRNPALFERGLILISLALSAHALAQKHGLAVGTLGNSGATSEAALPGALLGFWIAVVPPPRDQATPGALWRLLGAIAALVYAVFAGRVPVYAGAASFALATAISAFFLRSSAGRRAAMLAFLLAWLGLAWAARALSRELLDVRLTGQQLPPEQTAGGFEVRARIWKRLPGMVVDYVPFGVGPGQFAAAFPPYRDPLEIELSTHGRTIENETEVENAHNNWLEPLIETGPAGGLCWIAFLSLVALRALSCLRDGKRAGLALAGLGLLANALVRGPLLQNPAAAPLGFAIFGALLARGDPPIAIHRALGALVAAGLAVGASSSLSLVRHGRALGKTFASGELDHQALAGALAARPDSPLALGLDARSLQAQARSHANLQDEAEKRWRQVLERRPHRVEALAQLGLLHAERGELERAAWYLERAASLDPRHPAILRNLARLELLRGSGEGVRRWIEELRSIGLELGDLERWACEEMCALRVSAALALLGQVDARLLQLGQGEAKDAELAHALYEELRGGEREELARALRGYAHLCWARDQARAGEFKAAVRSYRQAKASLFQRTGGRESYAPELLAELAAASVLAGEKDAFERELGPEARARLDWSSLPEWVQETLRDHQERAH